VSGGFEEGMTIGVGSRISTSVALLGAALLVLASSACGGADPTAAPPTTKAAAPVCPAAWRAGWQRLANEVKAPVYCPSWLPQPLTGEIGAYGSGKYVEPDRSYLIAFFWLENAGLQPEEVHVNLRGYPGRSKIPICEDTVTVKGKVLRPKIPCFDDARAHKRFGSTTVTMYTANQGADQWHVLYAWRHRGSLYALSEHIARPYTYRQVVANLDRMMRRLVLLQPSA
jgi:hypothetical protein